MRVVQRPRLEWEDIVELLDGFPLLVAKHFPQFGHSQPQTVGGTMRIVPASHKAIPTFTRPPASKTWGFNLEEQAARDLVSTAWQDMDQSVVEMMRSMILLAGENNGQIYIADTDAGLQVVGLSRGGAIWDTTDGRTQAVLEDALRRLKEGRMPIASFTGRVGKLTRFGYLVHDALQGK